MRLISYTPKFNNPWTSLDDLNSWRGLFDSAFEQAGARTREGRWTPALDIHENSDQVVVSVEAAGLKKEDFEISLHDDNLTISGERKPAENAEGTKTRRERAYGAFSRTVTLPSAVKPDVVTASYVDGVLTVTLPKAEEAKPRKIEVNVH